MTRSLVIGAGMAGAACARALADAGHRVSVLDKGRSVGGRLAQRRTAEGVFDHGAQYIKARDPDLRAAVAGWVAEGVAADWPEAAEPEPTWIGTPSMSAPVKHLLRDIDTAVGRRVVALWRTPDGWTARDEAGVDHGPFDRIAVTIPAPQAASLLTATPEARSLAAAMAAVVMAPCWAGMLAFDAPLDLAREAVRFPPGSPLVWAARHRTKPGRGPAETWIAHAGPAWSRAHLERGPGEVAPLIVALLGEALGLDPLRPVTAAAHRWRHALVERALGRPFLLDPAIGLGICGDGCLGPRVEAAWQSGRALGAALAEVS